MSVLWTAAEAAEATGGQTTADWQAAGGSIDSRTVAPGDLFVALKDARDGHAFVADALAKGASAALVSRVPAGVARDAPLLVVDDVQRGLERLGAAGRARTGARVIAITGSVGKTSTKEMLRAALTGQGRVHAAEASYNNHWGVPLTLARMPADTDFALIEIGMNHPGEIAPLSRLARPHVVMVTIVAAAHLEAFDSLDGIAREKASIAEGLEPHGTAILNGDLGTSPILTAAAARAGARIETFGETEGVSHRLLSVRLSGETTVAQAEIGGARALFKLHSPGRHFAVNATGVLAAAAALGGDLALSVTGFGQWRPYKGRGTVEHIGLDPTDDRLRIDLIDDAYNANPASMAAALTVLAAARPVDDIGRIGHGRRIAILGDMLELGPDERRMHAELADLPGMDGIDKVHCVGPRMKALQAALPGDQRGRWAETDDALARHAHRLLDAGDVVLVKGSKASRVSRVVDAIRKLGHPLGTEFEGLN